MLLVRCGNRAGICPEFGRYNQGGLIVTSLATQKGGRYIGGQGILKGVRYSQLYCFEFVRHFS